MSRRRKVSTKRVEPIAAPPRSRAPIGLALILLLTFAVYIPALSGTQLWDDDDHITRPELQSASGLYRIWFEVGATKQYYPLLHSAFWLEHKLWGDSVLGYHLVNLLWHLCAVSLLYLIIVRLRIPGALLAAAIFAVHPVMVESVAWITEQKNTLSAVFYVSAVQVYLGFDESRLRGRYFLALGLFVLGLLTKTVTATLPAALLVIFWWQRGTLSWKRDVLPLVPFFVLGAMSGVLTAWIERTLIGAEGAGFEMTFVERCLLAGRVIWFYLSKLVWPANLMFFYPRWTLDPAVWWQWLFSIAALSVLILLWALRGKSRAPLAGWLLFVGTLFPVLGFLNVFPFIFSFVADHFQYLASLGLITLVAAGTAQYISRLETAGRFAASFLCVIVVGILAMLTFRQSAMYSDIFTLYRTTLARNSACWIAHNNLGGLLAKTNREDAIAHYQAALRLRPEYLDALSNLGYEFTQSGRYREAIEYLERAVRVQPDHSVAVNQLGVALTRAGQFPKAVDTLQAALKREPENFSVLNNLGLVLTEMGRPVDAIQYLEHATRVEPDNADARNNLGRALTNAGRMPEAIVALEAARAITPKEPLVLNNLGFALTQSGRLQEAIDNLQQALQIRPNYADAHNNLAIALFGINQTPKAIEHFQLAIKFDPKNANTHNNLAKLAVQLGDLDGAIVHFKEAVALQPDRDDVHAGLANVLRKSGQTQPAIEHYQTALRLKPDDAQSWAGLAQALAQVEHPNEAIAAAEKAIALSRASGQPAVAEEMEEWLSHYQTELRRAESATPSDSSPPPNEAPKPK